MCIRQAGSLASVRRCGEKREKLEINRIDTTVQRSCKQLTKYIHSDILLSKLVE